MRRSSMEMRTEEKGMNAEESTNVQGGESAGGKVEEGNPTSFQLCQMIPFHMQWKCGNVVIPYSNT